MKPNCYNCVHRRSIPGNAHSRCVHPALGLQADNEFTAMVEMLANIDRVTAAAQQLHLTGHRVGILRGWFLWPANFDPTWLLTCDGFQAKEVGDGGTAGTVQGPQEEAGETP